MNWLRTEVWGTVAEQLGTHRTGKYNRPIPFSLSQGIAPELFRTREVCRTRHDHAGCDKYHKLFEVLRYPDALEQPTKDRDIFQIGDTGLGFLPGILHDSPYDHRVPISDEDIRNGLSAEFVGNGSPRGLCPQ